MAIGAPIRCLGISLAAVLAGAGSGMAHADDDPLPSSRQQEQITRVDQPDIATHSLPGYRTDLSELSYQLWTVRGRAGVGVGIGSMSVIERPTGLLSGRPGESAALMAASGPMLMLGLRYRTTEHSSIYADAMHVRGFGPDLEDRVVSKVGIEFKLAQSDWKIGYGGLGFKLAGDARMTFRLRRSGFGIFMRSTF